MEIAEHSIHIRRDVIPYDDWREDPRWDQLVEYARELFGDGLEDTSARFRHRRLRRLKSGGGPKPDLKADWELVRAYLGGSTLQEIAEPAGITREGVRQKINRVAPWAIPLCKQRREARTRTKKALSEAIKEAGRIDLPCAVCGSPTRAPVNKPGAVDVKCSQRCRWIWDSLRNHLDDPVDREFIRPDGNRTDRAASMAYHEGMPIFQRLPRAVQAQIDGSAPRRWTYRRVLQRGQTTRSPQERREVRRWVNETIALPESRDTSADH